MHPGYRSVGSVPKRNYLVVHSGDGQPGAYSWFIRLPSEPISVRFFIPEQFWPEQRAHCVRWVYMKYSPAATRSKCKPVALNFLSCFFFSSITFILAILHTTYTFRLKQKPHRIAPKQSTDRPTDRPTERPTQKTLWRRQWLLARCKLPINEANNDGLYFSNVFWFLSTFFVLSSSFVFVFVVAHRVHESIKSIFLLCSLGSIALEHFFFSLFLSIQQRIQIICWTFFRSVLLLQR